MVQLYMMRMPDTDNVSTSELLSAKNDGERDWRQCTAQMSCMDSCSARFTKPSDKNQLVSCFKECTSEVCKHFNSTCNKIEDALPY